MKKLLLVLFLNVLLTPVAYAAPVYPISTPRLGEATENKTAKEKHHLIGPVQTVITEQTEFSRKDEKWVEGPRKRPSRMTFDVRGNFTELAEYNVEGSVLKSDKYSYSYDANGNVTEEVYHHADGSLGYRIVRSYDLSGRTTASSNYGADGSLSERSVMTYDAKGNMIERRIYGSDGAPKDRTVRSLDGRDTTEFYDSEGRPIWKQVSVHDDDGKPTEVKVYRDGSLSWIREMTYDAGGNLAETRQSFYDDSGSLRSKEVMKFDNRSNRAESAGYAADGSLSGRTVMTYDAKGNMIESIRYDGAGSVEEAWQYTHEFDPVGNWIRQVQSQAITEADGVRFVPTSVYYRTITYYPETKKPAAEKAEPPKSKQ